MRLTKPIKYSLITLGVLVGFGIIWIYSSVNPSEYSVFPECTFHSLTGYHCPGCGSQRALHDFLNFRFVEGLKHNALIGLACLIIMYQLFMWLRHKTTSEPKSNLLYHPKVPLLILIIVLLFWVLRNIPVEPFIHLAP